MDPSPATMRRVQDDSTEWESTNKRGDAMRKYYTYILASQKGGTLYTGMTNNLRHRAVQHKEKANPSFTSTYRVTRLVYFEEFADVRDAIVREKQIKGWTRIKKIELIESVNPEWKEIRL